MLFSIFWDIVTYNAFHPRLDKTTLIRFNNFTDNENFQREEIINSRIKPTN